MDRLLKTIVPMGRLLKTIVRQTSFSRLRDRQLICTLVDPREKSEVGAKSPLIGANKVAMRCRDMGRRLERPSLGRLIKLIFARPRAPRIFFRSNYRVNGINAKFLTEQTENFQDVPTYWPGFWTGRRALFSEHHDNAAMTMILA